MRVRFTDPQPGIFPVGFYTFVNGYHDNVPDAVYQDWVQAGLAVIADEPEALVEVESQSSQDVVEDDAPEVQPVEAAPDSMTPKPRAKAPSRSAKK